MRPDTGLSCYVGGTGIGPGGDLYQYTLSGAYDIGTGSYASKTIDMTPEHTGPKGVYFKPDGTKLYAISGTTVYQYGMSTAWDLGTGSYDSISFDSTAETTVLTGISFKEDGTKMILLDGTDDNIYEYDLSPAWDITTATYNSVFHNLSSDMLLPADIFILEFIHKIITI